VYIGEKEKDKKKRREVWFKRKGSATKGVVRGWCLAK